MSDQKCFTVIWEIKNFPSIFGIHLSKEFLELKSPSWRLTYEESEILYLTARVRALEVIFEIHPNTIFTNNNWEISSVSFCGTVPVKEELFGSFNINRKDIFGDNNYLVLPSDTLTVCCKFLKACTNIRELRFCSALHRMHFQWTIDNFSVLDETSHKTSWKKYNILFHINIIRTGKGTHMVTVSIEPSKGVFELHLLDFKFSLRMGSSFSVNNVNHLPNRRTWKANFCISELYSCAKTLPLEFKCIVAVNMDNTTTTTSSLKSIKTLTVCLASEGVKAKIPSVSVQDSLGTLSNDLLSILRDTTFSDATLNTEGKSFSAHKIILAARSSVFKAMFEKEDTTESRSGVVDIEDIDSETVQLLLVFLYGESFEELQWDEASKLYYAADKYAVLLLKQKCSNILKAGLSTSNACDAIALADRHSDDELIKGAVDYVREHQEVMSSSDWEKLEESDPRLAAKILRQVFVKTTTSYPTSEGIKNKSLTVVVQDSPGNLTSDLLSILRDTTLSDATLKTEGKSFSAHKIILAARSSVFRAMFEKQDTTESRSGVVDIEDIDRETVQRFLVFLYGESFEDLQWDEASKLYYAADKYAVLLLKQKCSNILKAGLSVSNACDAIVLADRHSDDELMKGAVYYVHDHQKVISSSDWEKLEESDPRLAAKILRQVFIKKSKN